MKKVDQTVVLSAVMRADEMVVGKASMSAAYWVAAMVEMMAEKLVLLVANLAETRAETRVTERECSEE